MTLNKGVWTVRDRLAATFCKVVDLVRDYRAGLPLRWNA